MIGARPCQAAWTRRLGRLFAVLLILAGTMMPAGAAPDDANWERLTDTVGRAGGYPFRQRCAPGAVVMGLEVFGDIDRLTGIRIYCAAPGSFELKGRNVGVESRLLCPNLDSVMMIKASTRTTQKYGIDYLRQIAVACVDQNNRAPTVIRSFVTYANPPRSSLIGNDDFNRLPGKALGCGADYVVGIYGDAGQQVNRLGLICGHKTFDGRVSSPDTCKQGYVWRAVTPGDHVCVPPTDRAMIKVENDQAAKLTDPARAPYCLPGYVWRAAVPGDQVCVHPGTRDRQKQLNLEGPSHRVGG